MREKILPMLGLMGVLTFLLGLQLMEVWEWYWLPRAIHLTISILIIVVWVVGIGFIGWFMVTRTGPPESGSEPESVASPGTSAKH